MGKKILIVALKKKKKTGVKVELTVLLSLKESIYIVDLFGEKLRYYARSL